jgi:hypothetical protein
MEKHQISTKDKNRLMRGWECITKDKKLMEMCKEYSRSEGAGMSIFMFRPGPQTQCDDGSNCDYYYTEKDGTLWDEYVNPSGGPLHLYVPEKHLVICITVPLGGETNEGEYITRMGLFDSVTFDEVDI